MGTTKDIATLRQELAALEHRLRKETGAHSPIDRTSLDPYIFGRDYRVRPPSRPRRQRPKPVAQTTEKFLIRKETSTAH